MSPDQDGLSGNTLMFSATDCSRSLSTPGGSGGHLSKTCCQTAASAVSEGRTLMWDEFSGSVMVLYN